MNTGKILITGATGDTGGYAIEQLLQKGHKVRALVHRIDDRSKRLEDRRVGVVASDYLDLDAMRAALEGVRRAYFVFPIRPGIIQATAYFAQAAREAGVEAVVHMSQISARKTPGATPPGTTGSPSGCLIGQGLPSRTCGRRSSPSGSCTRPRGSRPGRCPCRSGPASTHRSRPRTRPASSWRILEDPAPYRGKVHPHSGRRSTRTPRRATSRQSLTSPSPER